MGPKCPTLPSKPPTEGLGTPPLPYRSGDSCLRHPPTPSQLPANYCGGTIAPGAAMTRPVRDNASAIRPRPSTHLLIPGQGEWCSLNLRTAVPPILGTGQPQMPGDVRWFLVSVSWCFDLAFLPLLHQHIGSEYAPPHGAKHSSAGSPYWPRNRKPSDLRPWFSSSGR